MPLNMNTIGTGSGGSSSSGNAALFEINTNYREELTSNVQQIESATISVIKDPSVLQNTPMDGSRYYSYGSVYYNGFYYAIDQDAYDNKDKYLYKYNFVKNTINGKFELNVTKIPEMKGTVGLCLVQNKLLVATSPTSTVNSTSTCFYLFDGTSWTKISDTILSMIGSPSISAGLIIPWVLQPVLNDDLSFTGKVFAHYTGNGNSDVYRGMMYFQYNEKTGKITTDKYQWYRYSTYGSGDTPIAEEMKNLRFMDFRHADMLPLVFFVGVDKYIKIDYRKSTDEIKISLFKWEWGRSTANNDNYNGASDKLTLVFEKSIKSPVTVKPKDNIKILVEPLSYPKYDAYSIIISHWDEYIKSGSGTYTRAYIDDIWILNIKSYDFSIVDSDFQSASTVLLDRWKSGNNPHYLAKATMQLYDNEPYIIALFGSAYEPTVGGTSTFGLIRINVNGNIDASGSTYTYSGDLIDGDTIYSDDGILSVMVDGILNKYDSITKYDVTKTGKYTIVTKTNSPYIRPAFVIKTVNGSLLHLDVESVSETDITGYFLKNMKVNRITTTKSGFQTVSNAIENSRVVVELQ